MRCKLTLPLLALAAVRATCYCPCGYDAFNDRHAGIGLFTEIVETDFLHVDNIQPKWVAQAYNRTPSDANGPFGEAAQVENVKLNYIPFTNNWTGPGVLGPYPGLQLWTRASLIDIPGTNESMVPIAEIVSSRNDILYGTFRVAMMTAPTYGTCGGFFFYINDSAEIDMEFLSKQQQHSSGFMNLVIHSPASAEQGYVDNNSSDFNKQNLTFGPGMGYNEYRFDWLPDRIDFYANGVLLSTMTENVPDTAGSIHLIHWSNGNAGWSAGPPKDDAALTISYVKAYFNSSNAVTTKDSLRNCTEGSGYIPCRLPYQTIPPNPLEGTGETPFYTHDPPPPPPPAPTPSSLSAESSVAGSHWLFLVACFFAWL